MFALATLPYFYRVVQTIEEEAHENDDVIHMRDMKKKLLPALYLPRLADLILLIVVSVLTIFAFSHMTLPSRLVCAGILTTQIILMAVASKVKKVYIDGTLFPI